MESTAHTQKGTWWMMNWIMNRAKVQTKVVDVELFSREVITNDMSRQSGKQSIPTQSFEKFFLFPSLGSCWLIYLFISKFGPSKTENKNENLEEVTRQWIFFRDIVLKELLDWSGASEATPGRLSYSNWWTIASSELPRHCSNEVSND